MRPRLRRRCTAAALAAMMAGVAALAVGIAAPALATPHVATDGSAGRPTATPGSSSLLGVDLGAQSLSVNVAGVSIDAGALVRGLTGGNAPPGSSSTRSRPAPSSAAAPKPRSHSASVPPTTHPSHPVSHRRVTHHRTSSRGSVRRAAADRRAPVAARAHQPAARKTHRTSHPAHHQLKQRVGSKRHRLLGAQLLHDVVRPGSPAQILTLLVIMCAIGTALMVSLARRKDPKPMPVRSRSQDR